MRVKAVIKQRWLGDAIAFGLGLPIVWAALYIFGGQQQEGIFGVAQHLNDFNWITLWLCLSLGIVWLCLRDVAFRIAAMAGWRSLSAILTILCACGAWYSTDFVRNTFHLGDNEKIAFYMVVFVCLGWGLISEVIYRFPPANRSCTTGVR